MLKLLKSISILLGILSLVALSTNSYFSSQASITGNQFSTGTWQTPEPSPSPSPTPTSTPQAKVVINEVYYDVAFDKGEEGDASNPDEWLELYNGGNVSINLKDWTIADDTTTRTIQAASHILAPGAYALIAKDNSTWSLYWSVPSGVEIIELGQKIGNGLTNAGDHLILKDALGNIVDEISWGTDTTILNPSVIDVAEGHSIERNPAGVDTDTAVDLVDRATPTPGS